ncbi:hypothetical protein A9Q81_20135 [Gammaproteobacteria bacterium 42_54_T18]|mgnify:CR=1 FL=1|nr:hypothetical protein A9Q81_20135 [Gammaproteobacteria bacterium 42_54_T18]
MTAIEKTAIEKTATENTALHMNPYAKQTDYHPNNYFRRDNDALRPAPDRVKNNPAWYPMRKFLLNGLRPLGKYTPPTMVGDYPDRVNDLYWQGDELMDNVVASMRDMKGGEGRKMFTKAMKEGIDSIDNPPEAFVALFEQLDRVPDWVDWDEIDAGGAYFSNLPFWAIGIGAFLPTLYTTHGYATSIPVGATGRFVRQKENRMVEGIHFITSIAEPDGLRRYSYGFECAVHIRLMHAFVRAQMYKKNGEYFDYSTDGDPMSQPDTLVGIPVFGISNLLFLRAMGGDVSEKQMRSVDMMWRYVVYLMGGHENAIPQNLEESLYLLDHYIATQGKPSVFSDELNKAFFVGVKETIQERAPAWQKPLVEFIFADVVGSFTWHMVGDELAEEVKYLKKPNAVTKHLPKLLRGWAKVNSMRGKYRPNERWSHRFHHEGAFINGYKKFMLIRDDETNVDFKSHDNTKASDLGKKSAFSS